MAGPGEDPKRPPAVPSFAASRVPPAAEARLLTGFGLVRALGLRVPSFERAFARGRSR